MEVAVSLAIMAAGKVLETFLNNWYLLLISIAVAAWMKVYVDQQKVSAWLNKYRGAGIFGSTFFAVMTPLCSCGTTAVILGMMASSMSWAPLVAFMVASPLTSPGELFYSASLFGWPFAVTFFLASILLGIAGGGIAYVLENRGLLKNQARLMPVSGGSGEPLLMADASAGAVGNAVAGSSRLPEFGRELLLNGRRLLLFFGGFAFVGYLLNGLIPQEWVGTFFSGGTIYGVPLAATLGLPFYINTEASLPLVRSLWDLGMSPGATLAFLITGAGTSLGAIAGALTIARWRVVAIVVATLWSGAVLLGYLYNLLLQTGVIA